jgi:hypothetical protein
MEDETLPLWEYDILEGVSPDTEPLKATLNQMGGKGWRFVKTEPNGSALRVYFERPLLLSEPF